MRPFVSEKIPKINNWFVTSEKEYFVAENCEERIMVSSESPKLVMELILENKECNKMFFRDVDIKIFGDYIKSPFLYGRYPNGCVVTIFSS
jgi:hypothetical protein